jgi:MFS transporter, DHA1 family, multidrug resistance protein
MATMVVPMVAPTVGVALLALGGWRVIHAVLAGIGVLLLLAVALGFSESAVNQLIQSVVVRYYLRVLKHPFCLGCIFVNAASFGSLFAYVSGSSLFLINVVGLGPEQYGLTFAATSLGIMGGAFLNSRLNASGISPGYPLTVSLALRAAPHLEANHDTGRLDAALPGHSTPDPRHLGLRANCA